MKSPTDSRLHAEAERRSQPVATEATLEDAVWWLTHDALVKPERISGLVIDGEVYDFTYRVEWAPCIREPQHADGHQPGAVAATRAGALAAAERVRDVHLACGRVLSRIVADTGWRAA
ncbi:hypothetical protein [Isoptericola aurantiacus]|uniref:hypothetical protein n=1 Tax=Isoptericola aurantiacus TaxID=3377839 RepID=UPI00383B63C4